MTDTTQKSLYEKLGGDAAVQAAVEKLYIRILADPLLAPYFSYDRLGLLEQHQVAFLTMAFGGPNKYTGRRLEEVHEPMVHAGVGDEHFNAVAHHLEAVLVELGVARPLIDEVLAIVETTRAPVLGRHV